MFKKGNYVINSNNGICEIQDVVTMNMSGVAKEYYLLVPVSEPTAKVYIPVDERYFKLVENQLHAELAFALGEPKQNIVQIIESELK